MIKAVLLCTLPLAAQADGWEEFQARCVDPYENLFPPIVAGLQPVTSGENEPEYRLRDREMLVLELAPDDGEMACRLEDQSGQAEAGFNAWIAQGVKAARYEDVGDGQWQSYNWVEPVVAVQKWQEGTTTVVRILVTDLES